jgi:proline iminopeptidase
MPRLTLYPEIEPLRTHMLPVSGLHTVYVEECGNPDGKPVVMVHGGPGGGSNPPMRRYHDPKAYRIILFDQRGCGRSTPHAELRENTTWDLVADMERIRTHLGIERWQVFGGSWGSTLSLAYAETHPERVTELVLRGIFMIRRFEIDWFYVHGASNIFPDRFEAYEAHIPEAERGDMIAAYYRRLTDPDPAVQLTAAKLWAGWEGSALSLLPNPAREKAFTEDRYAIAFARIESHYFQNRGFFDRDDYLLHNAGRIAAIPGVVVHGRYDMCTPVINAWHLKKAWPEADLRIVEDAGHAMSEPGIVDELVSATRRFAGQ